MTRASLSGLSARGEIIVSAQVQIFSFFGLLTLFGLGSCLDKVAGLDKGYLYKVVGQKIPVSMKPLYSDMNDYHLTTELVGRIIMNFIKITLLWLP